MAVVFTLQSQNVAYDRDQFTATAVYAVYDDAGALLTTQNIISSAGLTTVLGAAGTSGSALNSFGTYLNGTGAGTSSYSKLNYSGYTLANSDGGAAWTLTVNFGSAQSSYGPTAAAKDITPENQPGFTAVEMDISAAIVPTFRVDNYSLPSGAGISNPGRTIDVPVASIDWYPTLLELAGIERPRQVLDGISLLPLLKGEPSLMRDRLFWHFPCYVGRNGPAGAVRDGNWKLLEFFEDGGRRELYDLAADPAEETDLSKSNPQKLRELATILDQWQSETQAAIPTEINPSYDPASSRSGGKGGGTGGRDGAGNAGKKGGKGGQAGKAGKGGSMNRGNPPRE